MTSNRPDDATTHSERCLSLLPEPVMRIRVRPADYARMLGVSRQSVSRWVQKGHVVLGVDGRLDPEAETRRLLRTVDPKRLRARLLRPLAEEVEGLSRELDLVKGERDAALAKANRLQRERDQLSAANSMQADDIAELERRNSYLELIKPDDDEDDDYE